MERQALSVGAGGAICVSLSGETSAVCGGRRDHMCVSVDRQALSVGAGGAICVFQWRDKHCLWGQEEPYVCVSVERQALSVGAGGAICVSFSGETSVVCGGGRGHTCVFQWRDKHCLWGREGPYVCVSMERQAQSVGVGGAIRVCKITEAGGGQAGQLFHSPTCRRFLSHSAP